ncbi:MAG: BtrH N-terminal domain-containing protein [Candidatus Promineifilaceae bacterium]
MVDITEAEEHPSLRSLPGFKSLSTHHCYTGSLRHIYEYHGYPISEDLLLGLGSGLGFVYWHMKGTDPFYGGRANVGRPKEEGLEKTAGRRTGVRAESFSTSSVLKAERALLEMLEAGEPVYLYVDMGFLPYLELPDDYHFGAHVVVAAGYDPQSDQVLIADRDVDLHRLALADLAKARGSTYKPFPPRHKWYTFDFGEMREPMPEEVRQAIREVTAGMLEPPIANLGVRGIRTAYQRTRKWPEIMNEETLRWSCFNIFIFIDAIGGTGGGLFRTMYGRFLQEAAGICSDDRIAMVGQDLGQIGDLWQEVASRFKEANEAENISDKLLWATEPMLSIADREETAWQQLRSLVD